MYELYKNLTTTYHAITTSNTILFFMLIALCQLFVVLVLTHLLESIRTLEYENQKNYLYKRAIIYIAHLVALVIFQQAYYYL